GIVAAVEGGLHRPGQADTCGERVVTGQARNLERVLRLLTAGQDARLRGQSVHDQCSIRRVVELDGVVPGRPVGDHRVGRAVSAGVGAAQVDVEGLGVRAGEVADVHGVGAAERAEVHVLDAGEVHHDARDVTCEAHARAVRRNVDLLRDVRAVE